MNTSKKRIHSNERPAGRQVRNFIELTKPRLSMMTVVTAAVGYLAALPQRNSVILLSLIIGTSLAAAGAAVLNQWMERDTDAKMERTKDRPIPSGKIDTISAAIFGITLSLAGDVVLFLGTNILATVICVVTQVIYLGIYTPLKKRTTWNTAIGAIPGAMPPLIGWAAAADSLSTMAWILFALMVCWQIPHFMAIAYTYRKDYEKAGLKMSTVIDPSGQKAARESLLFTFLLIIVTLLPPLLGKTSWVYGVVALITGYGFLRHAWHFLFGQKREKTARRFFFMTIGYLPLLLAVLVLDRWLLTL